MSYLEKIKIFVFALALIVGFFSRDGLCFEIKNEIDYVGVYYTHPRFAVNIPYDKSSIESEGDHQVIIWNEEKISELQAFFNKVLKEKKASSGLTDNLRFKVNIIYLDRTKVTFYIDMAGNFEFASQGGNSFYGRISESDFNEFVEFCESISGIVDLETQRRKLLEFRTKF